MPLLTRQSRTARLRAEAAEEAALKASDIEERSMPKKYLISQILLLLVLGLWAYWSFGRPDDDWTALCRVVGTGGRCRGGDGRGGDGRGGIMPELAGALGVHADNGTRNGSGIVSLEEELEDVVRSALKEGSAVPDAANRDDKDGRVGVMIVHRVPENGARGTPAETDLVHLQSSKGDAGQNAKLEVDILRILSSAESGTSGLDEGHVRYEMVEGSKGMEVRTEWEAKRMDTKVAVARQGNYVENGSEDGDERESQDKDEAHAEERG